MDNIEDQEKILQRNPWIFRNSWLLLQPWDRITDPKSYIFDQVPIWIQLWGLPHHCKTKAMGKSIGSLLGQVSEAELYKYSGKKVIIKVKVDIHVRNPIIPGIHIGNTIYGTNWIDFRYENLPQMCFDCGLVGHPEKFFRNPKLEVEEASLLGPWIRFNIYCRRIIYPKDRKFYSNPIMAKNYGNNSPSTPEDLLKQLEDMRIQEAKEMNPPLNPLKRPHETPANSPTQSHTTMQHLNWNPTQIKYMEWSGNTTSVTHQIESVSSLTQAKKLKVATKNQHKLMAGLQEQAGQGR